MSQTTSVKSIFSQTTPSGEPYEPISKIAGFGGIIGLIAGIIGLISNTPLLPLPGMGLDILKTQAHVSLSTFFLLMLSFGILIQMLESKDLRNRLGSGLANTGYLTGLIGFLLLAVVFVGGIFWNNSQEVLDYLTITALLTAVFLILWEMWSVIYVDSSNSIFGMLAGIFNGFALPLMAVGFAIPILLPVSYIMLIIGQLMVILFWWSPITSIREISSSPSSAKLAFGIYGLITFAIGAVAVFSSFSTISQTTPVVADIAIWVPFTEGILINQMIAPLIWAFAGCLIFWILLSTRLSKLELKATKLQNDLVHGGLKYVMVFFAALTVFAAGQIGTFIITAETMEVIEGLGNFGTWIVTPETDVVQSYQIFLTWGPSAVLFIMGALYVSKTDVISGLPMLITSIFLLGYPYVLAEFVLIPFILILVSQTFLIAEARLRGFTYFTSPVLTVIITIAFSAFFVLILLGGLGSGPAAMWPTNFWFNITLFPGIDKYIQASTILIFPILALLVRNVALAGYVREKEGGSSGSNALIGMSILFALMIPLIGAAWKGVTHQALTAAAILFALYAISFILVLSVNLNMAGDVEDTGNPIEGMLIRLTALSGIIMGAFVGMVVLGVFAGFPTPLEVAGTITLLVFLIAGLEALTLIGWLSAGVRLGMMTKGFKFISYTDAIASAEAFVPEE